MTNPSLEPFISAAEIADKVQELGARISRDHQDKQPLVILSVLKGAFIFTADLMRNLSIPCELHFIQLSSYSGTKSTGQVKTLSKLDVELSGRRVLIVEDIVETGLTLEHLRHELADRGAAHIATAALLHKPHKRLCDVSIDYVGFELDDAFVVGYGLDYNEAYRGLPDIAVLRSGEST